MLCAIGDVVKDFKATARGAGPEAVAETVHARGGVPSPRCDLAKGTASPCPNLVADGVLSAWEELVHGIRIGWTGLEDGSPLRGKLIADVGGGGAEGAIPAVQSGGVASALLRTHCGVMAGQLGPASRLVRLWDRARLQVGGLDRGCVPPCSGGKKRRGLGGRVGRPRRQGEGRPRRGVLRCMLGQSADKRTRPEASSWGED